MDWRTIKVFGFGLAAFGLMALSSTPLPIGTSGHKLCFLDTSCNFTGGLKLNGTTVSSFVTDTIGDGLQEIGGVLEATGGRTKVIAGASTVTLANADCGGVVASNGVNPETVIIPTSPPTGCTYTFKAGLSKTRIVFPSGQGLVISGWTNNPITVLPITGTIQNTKIQITYHGDLVSGPWTVTYGDRILLDLIMTRDVSIYAPNGSYLSHNSGSSRFELNPLNGGGIITNGKMMVVPDAGLFLPDAGTTNSTLNYIYAYSNADSDGVVSGAADNGSGHIRLTITHGATTGAQVYLACYSIAGAIQANDYTTGTVIDSTHIDEAISSSGLGTYTSGGQCRMLELRASTTAPVVVANGVQSMSGDAHYTLVGTAVVGASHAIARWTSYFNSQLNVIGNPTTVAALGTCNSDAEGTHSAVIDATVTLAAGIGTIVAGGGTNHDPVYCNANNWIVG